MDELHRAALRATVLRQAAFVSNDLELAVAVCDSPLERAFLYAFTIVGWDLCDGVLVRTEATASGLLATRGAWVEIQPQAQIEPDRVDFLLAMRIRSGDDDRAARMVVECDGHEWHERTREQANRDRARDRRIQSTDLAVFRYTGSELWADVFDAASNAVEELNRRFDDGRDDV